jgi:hypothetical protein
MDEPTIVPKMTAPEIFEFLAKRHRDFYCSMRAIIHEPSLAGEAGPGGVIETLKRMAYANYQLRRIGAAILGIEDPSHPDWKNPFHQPLEDELWALLKNPEPEAERQTIQ